MAVVVLEKKLMEGKEYEVKVYKIKLGKLLTLEEKEKADRFERILSERIKKIETDMEKNGLLSLKGKKGKVLKLWYEVGKNLSFVMDTSLVDPEERQYVFRAIYDHTKKLNPGPLTKRVLRDPATSHFSYCYKLSTFTWDFVKSAGDWTSWSEFFDRRETKNNENIIKWLSSKVKGEKIKSRQNWLRPLTKEIHKEFLNKDTIVFSPEELYDKLDKIFNDLKKSKNEK